MTVDESWLQAPREIRQQVEHRMLLQDWTESRVRRPRLDFRMSCSCGLVVEQRLAGPISAYLLHVIHVSLATGPAVCPRCGSGKPHHGHRQLLGGTPGDSRGVEVPCAITCGYVPWADDLCPRCDLAVQLDFLADDAARVSRRMLKAAS